ncbi:MAG: DNA repair protein RecO [Candidatus Cloacimonetes bacterium]|nr:DNA repair protein RecO [Candidatus Cloacimonadota bacterium]MCK9185729.1 DNA repair protein RecO [Candidatus Cloacimonadota bacterium]MDY0230129.1 DNA repair protein RecO [Candidatus Cloacimonadaceae bacterium]
MIKCMGIVLSIFSYSESSLILKVLSWDKAQISIIAKGWRKKPEPILRFVEYEFTLYAPKEEGLYLLKELCQSRDFSSYASTSTWAAAEAGAELCAKIIIPSPEAKQYYTLLTQYLGYIAPMQENAILIFWRLMLRIFTMLGIGIRLQRCDSCLLSKEPFAYNLAGEIICQDCLQKLPLPDIYTQLSPVARKVLLLLPEIANHLQDIHLAHSDISQINQLFLSYFAAHQKQTLKLKSLSVLSQFYQ